MSHKRRAKRRLGYLTIIANEWNKMSPEAKRAVRKASPALHYYCLVVTSLNNSEIL